MRGGRLALSAEHSSHSPIVGADLSALLYLPRHYPSGWYGFTSGAVFEPVSDARIYIYYDMMSWCADGTGKFRSVEKSLARVVHEDKQFCAYDGVSMPIGLSRVARWHPNGDLRPNTEGSRGRICFKFI